MDSPVVTSPVVTSPVVTSPVVTSSVYCLPADLLGEGADRIVTQLRTRADPSGSSGPRGSLGVTVAASYHASRDILPHNPRYRLATMAPGAFYATDPTLYPGDLRPVHSPSAGGRDILAEACQAAAPHDLPVSAWAVLLHRDDLDANPSNGQASWFQQNCFGDRFPGRLCPANPAVQDYALAMIRDLCRYPITTLRAEALHYQGATHGHHHERCLEDYGDLARWLLGLCFCPSCTARGTQNGADVPALAARCRAYLTQAFADSAPAAPAVARDPAVSPAPAVSTETASPAETFAPAETFSPAETVWNRSLTEACGPDILPYLAARTTTVTSLIAVATAEARQRGVRLTLLDETIPAQAYATGHGFDPAHVAVRAEFGVDPRALATAGVHLEEPVYLTDPADVSAAIAWYRAQAGPAAPLSVLLRPGHPDTRSGDTLRTKAQLVQSHDCTELNFYAYGLYRLQALDRIRQALAP